VCDVSFLTCFANRTSDTRSPNDCATQRELHIVSCDRQECDIAHHVAVTASAALTQRRNARQRSLIAPARCCLKLGFDVTFANEPQLQMHRVARNIYSGVKTHNRFHCASRYLVRSLSHIESSSFLPYRTLHIYTHQIRHANRHTTALDISVPVYPPAKRAARGAWAKRHASVVDSSAALAPRNNREKTKSSAFESSSRRNCWHKCWSVSNAHASGSRVHTADGTKRRNSTLHRVKQNKVVASSEMVKRTKRRNARKFEQKLGEQFEMAREQIDALLTHMRLAAFACSDATPHQPKRTANLVEQQRSVDLKYGRYERRVSS
jgi:hypothetical protein